MVDGERQKAATSRLALVIGQERERQGIRATGYRDGQRGPRLKGAEGRHRGREIGGRKGRCFGCRRHGFKVPSKTRRDLLEHRSRRGLVQGQFSFWPSSLARREILGGASG